MQNFLKRLIHVRIADWLIAAIALWALVAFVAPAQLRVSVYKMVLVAMAAVAGYWIDRSLIPYAWPNQYLEPLPDVEFDKPETAFTDLSGAVSFSEGVKCFTRAPDPRADSPRHRPQPRQHGPPEALHHGSRR